MFRMQPLKLIEICKYPISGYFPNIIYEIQDMGVSLLIRTGYSAIMMS
jgi:hypothetical protein